MIRLHIDDIQTGEELRRWYWLKAELADYCKRKKLSYVGAKFDILERIATALDKGVAASEKTGKFRPTSSFDWANAVLTPDTVITDSYENGRNTRAFFRQHCGGRFHFSIPFMEFIRNNFGTSLRNAIEEWHRLNEQRKDKQFKSEIPEGNQYNRYMRDFFADNPGMTMAEARHLWKLKRSLPLSRHRYERSDLDLR